MQRTNLLLSPSDPSSSFPAPRRLGASARGLGWAPALLVAASACAGEAAPSAAGEEPEVVATVAVAQEVQEQIDALLLTADALEARLAVHGAALAEVAPARQLAATLGELVQSAEALRAGELDGAGRLAAIRALSQRSGQLVPQLRSLKQALAKSSLSEADRQALAGEVARVRWTAVQLNRSAGRYQSEAERAAGAGRALRNGPLFPGSAFWVLDEGHIDPIDAAFEDGAMELSIHDETTVPDVEREHEHTIMVVKAAAKTTVPDARFAFIGPVGRTFWMLPEGQLDAEAAGILWPGLSAEEVEPGVFVNDELQFRFKEVHGPNGLSLFVSPSDETAPPELRVDSEDGLPDVVTLMAGSHQHLNWAFESAGIYLVKADVRGRLAAPGTPWVTSATETLVFVVMP